MIASKWSATWPIDLPATASGFAFASSTVSGSSGHPGVSATKPLSSKCFAQGSQLVGRSHNPWMKTTGVAFEAFARSICVASLSVIGGASAVADTAPPFPTPGWTPAPGLRYTRGIGLARRAQDAGSGDRHRALREVFAREVPDQPVRRLGGILARDPVAGDGDRHEIARDPGGVLPERHLEDPGHARDAVGRERVVADEVPERVGDQPAAVPLHSAQYVRSAADDDVGAGVDHGVRERDR